MDFPRKKWMLSSSAWGKPSLLCNYWGKPSFLTSRMNCLLILMLKTLPWMPGERIALAMFCNSLGYSPLVTSKFLPKWFWSVWDNIMFSKVQPQEAQKGEKSLETKFWVSSEFIFWWWSFRGFSCPLEQNCSHSSNQGTVRSEAGGIMS